MVRTHELEESSRNTRAGEKPVEMRLLQRWFQELGNKALRMHTLGQMDLLLGPAQDVIWKKFKIICIPALQKHGEEFIPN